MGIVATMRMMLWMIRNAVGKTGIDIRESLSTMESQKENKRN
jgi:hypothetical protein